MGCISGKSQKELIGSTQSEGRLPKFAKSQFHAALYNIKVVGHSSCEDFSICFQLLEQSWFLYSRKGKHEGDTLSWPTTFERELYLSSESANCHKLFICLKTSSLQSLPTKIEVDLPLILTGPIHHNFKILLQKQYHILFDFKISQLINLDFQIKQAEVHLKQQHPGQQFHFSCRTSLTQHDDNHHTQSSYTIKAPLNTFSASSHHSHSGDQIAVPFTPPSQNAQTMVWNNGALPSFPMYVRAGQLSKHSIQFLLWGVAHKTETEEEAVLMGDASLPLWKFMEEETIKRKLSQESTSTVETPFLQFQPKQRTIKLQTPLTLHQKTIGSISLTVCIKNHAYIMQKKYLTRTNRGITTLLSPQKVDSLSALTISLTRDIHPQQKLFKIQQELTLLQERLSKTNVLLVVKNHKEAQELVASQNKMLSILQALCTYTAMEDSLAVAQRFWQLIVGILERKEFELQQIGSWENDINSVARVKVACRFRDTLIRLLAIVLEEQNGEASRMSAPYHDYLCAFKGYCFLRIPFFNTLLLRMIVATQCDQLSKLIKQAKKNQPSIAYVAGKKSWEQFFSWTAEKGTQPNTKDLEQCFKRSEWVAHIEKKEDQFYYFVSQIITKPLPKCQETYQHSVWRAQTHLQEQSQDQPLLIAFLQSMQKDNVCNYSTQLHKTALDLLKRESLINIYMKLITQHTSLFNVLEVYQVMKLIFQFLAVVTKDGKKPLFQYFDQQLFFKIVETVMESEHYMVKTEAIRLIFYFYNCFSKKLTRTITFFLLGKAFFGLFFFWGPQVRYNFYQFLVVKIPHTNNQLHTRYLKVISLAFAAADVHKQQISKMKLSNHQSYFKQMNTKRTARMIEQSHPTQCNLSTEQKTNPYSLIKLYAFVTDKELRLYHKETHKGASYSQLSKIESCAELEMKHSVSHTPTKLKKRDDTQDPQTEISPVKEQARTEKKRERRYTEINFDYELYTTKQISETERRVIFQACKQFRKVQEEVEAYRSKNKALPNTLFEWKAEAAKEQ